MGWRDGSTEFQPKINKILTLVDQLANDGDLSIVGTSAGGSAALNIFLERPKIIKKAVSICGRIKTGNHKWRSLERMSATSATFRQSVLRFEQKEGNMADELRQRVMTVTARFGDELVPSDTSILEGACNIKVPTLEHVFSIAMALTLFAKPVIHFIQRP